VPNAAEGNGGNDLPTYRLVLWVFFFAKFYHTINFIKIVENKNKN
jgi:hypothetical protein